MINRHKEELSNEYHHGKVWMAFKHFSGRLSCIKVAAALKGLPGNSEVTDNF